MPKDTFFNLPEDKRESIILAAKKEFSRAPLSEASVSNILKQTKIPRGSFYQYFEDKEDIFFYLLERRTEMSKNKFLEYLQQNDGDLADTFVDIFKHWMHEFTKEEEQNFFRNIFLNMNYKIERFFTKEMNLDEHLSNIEKNVDVTSLNISENTDVILIIKIFGTITLRNIVQSFAKEKTYEEAMKFFIKDMELLKNGIYKQT